MKPTPLKLSAATAAALLGAVSLANATVYSTAVLADNPVVYYQFDETAGATTAVNSGSAGSFDTPGVGATLPTFGVGSAHPNMGTAVDLGTVGYFDLPNGGGAANYGTYLNTDNVTLEFWINTTTTSQGGGGGWNQATLLGDDNGGCCGGGGADSWWGVLESATEAGKGGVATDLVIGVNTGNNPINVTSDTFINDGNWHHVVFTRGASTPANNVSVYIDGQFENFTSIGSAPTNTYNTIGNTEDGTGTQHLDALIDEMAIYNTELSAAQILNHYNVGLGIPEPSTGVLALLGLAAFGARRKRRA